MLKFKMFSYLGVVPQLESVVQGGGQDGGAGDQEVDGLGEDLVRGLRHILQTECLGHV